MPKPKARAPARIERVLPVRQGWAVFVSAQSTMHKGPVYQAFFRSGVQYFPIGYECSEDEGGKKQAQWFARMFLKALENIGVHTEKRKRR
jgi:hypothetical protein